MRQSVVGRKMSWQGGQAVVEFAVVLPILLLLILGLVNLGILVNAQIILTHAAWEGARAGATLDPSIEAGDDHIQGAVQAALVGLVRPEGVSIDIQPFEQQRDQIPWPGPRGQPLTIRLRYSLELAFPFPLLVPLGAQATSRIEYSNPP